MRLVQIKTLCWFLETQMKKMSSDRNLKVCQLFSFPDATKLIVKTVEEREIVRVGVFFRLFQVQSAIIYSY
jgi:hypothetical protein